ncbi:Xylose ABC transporter, periplasmic xylose-binding protein XylF [Klebsiella pneumoniae]|uniref:Xylose ABC transporter, periplasmic xylose-binding protein XylF n=1 Tax=Klebsiella pneumoniae TaxID=573 RepID=A0A4P0YI21_KLEPN|nr:Xylose ABC transporter, periplasmic xylose-binding protein XylF [Klebsiella pneumoniae]
MINNADIDFYISFDNEKVGEMQAQSLVDKVPQGNYFLMAVRRWIITLNCSAPDR